MRVVIDTLILVKGAVNKSWSHTSVMHLLPLHGHYLVLDYQESLLGEYRVNVGHSELYQKWYKELQSNSLIYWYDGQINNRIGRDLNRLGMNGTVDQVVVALALCGDKFIVTEDRHFGKGDSGRAATYQNVLTYLTNDLGLTVCNAPEACAQL